MHRENLRTLAQEGAKPDQAVCLSIYNANTYLCIMPSTFCQTGDVPEAATFICLSAWLSSGESEGSIHISAGTRSVTESINHL